MFYQDVEFINYHSKTGGKIQFTRNIVEENCMLVKRFEQKFSCKEVRTRYGLFYFVAWQNEIEDDLSDADHIIRFQWTFAGYTLMIDECAIGAVQVHDRNLFYRLIHPDFGVVARSRSVFHNNIIREGAANGCLSIP
jgi:hypothetical protein